MAVYEITKFSGGISDYEDKGIAGAFKFGSGLDIRKIKDSLSCAQALVDEGVTLESASPSQSPSASISPSSSPSPSPSASVSPSASASPSPKSPSASISPSASRSPSASASPSASVSPSSSGSPSPSPTEGLNTVFRDLIRTFVKASDGKVYGFGHTGKIYKRNSDGYWVQVYDAQEPITGAAEKPSYGGNIYLEWAGRTTLHRKQLPGLANWNDVDAAGSVQGDTWPKTNLTDADFHTMAQVNGSVLICNYSFLANSAYDDSYTNEALDLVPGNVAKTILERDGEAVIGTYKAGDPDKGVNAALDSEVPLAQVGDNGELFYADFINSMPAKRFPGGGKVNPGGVCNLIDPVEFFRWQDTALSWTDKQKVGNLSMWGVYDADSGRGGVYSYGRKDKNHPFVLNLDYLLDVDEIGAICSVDGVILASYRDGNDFGVKRVDLATKAQGVYEGLDFKAPVKKPINVTVWKQAELLFDPLPNGASLEFWYKINKTGNFIRAKTANGQNSFSVADAKKAVFRIVAEGDIFEPKVVLNPTGNLSPEVHRIRVYFN